MLPRIDKPLPYFSKRDVLLYDKPMTELAAYARQKISLIVPQLQPT